MYHLLANLFSFYSDHLSVGAIFSLAGAEEIAEREKKSDTELENVQESYKSLKKTLESTLTTAEFSTWRSFERAEDEQKRHKRNSPRTIDAAKSRSKKKQAFLSSLSDEKQQLLRKYTRAKKKQSKKKKPKTPASPVNPLKIHL